MTEERILRASELLGCEAVDIAAGAAVGFVRELALGPDGALQCLGIETPQWYSPGKSVPVLSVAAVLDGRLLIRPGSALEAYNPAGLQTVSSSSGPGGRNLLCLNEGALGRLCDLCFRLSDGALLEVSACSNDGAIRSVKVRSVTALGPDCLIIEALDEAAEKERAERKRLLKQELGALELAAAPAAAAAPPRSEPELAELPVEDNAIPEIEDSPGLQPELALASLGAHDGPQDASAPEAESAAAIGEMLAARAWAAAQGQPQPEMKPVRGSGAASQASTDPSTEAGLFPQTRARRGIEQLPLFDQRKAQYLLGKPLRRDVFGPDGALLCERGRPVDEKVLDAMIASGVLESVFLEMTTVTR